VPLARFDRLRPAAAQVTTGIETSYEFDEASGSVLAGRPAAVITDGLTKRYGRRPAVDRLSIEVPVGVVAGFIGPNGAGKTTTMAMLLGLVRPTSGTATVLGAGVEKLASVLIAWASEDRLMPPEHGRRLAELFPNANLWRSRTATP
jgi:ABC-type sugar transport system ATPase subunit